MSGKCLCCTLYTPCDKGPRNRPDTAIWGLYRGSACSWLLFTRIRSSPPSIHRNQHQLPIREWFLTSDWAAVLGKVPSTCCPLNLTHSVLHSCRFWDRFSGTSLIFPQPYTHPPSEGTLIFTASSNIPPARTLSMVLTLARSNRCCLPFPGRIWLGALSPRTPECYALMRVFTSTVRLNLTPVSCPSPNHLQGWSDESKSFALTPGTAHGLPLQPNASILLFGKSSQSPMDPPGILSSGLLLNLGFSWQPRTPPAEACALHGYGIAESQLPSKWAVGCNSGRWAPGCVPA